MHHARTTLAVGLTLASLAIAAPAGAHTEYGGQAAYTDRAHVRQYPRCAQEDSALCVWDARHMGNGVGTSFVSGPPRNPAPRTYAVPHRIAHRLIARDNWRRAPLGSRWDTVGLGPARTFTAGPGAVITRGDTTYVVRRNGTVGGS